MTEGVLPRQETVVRTAQMLRQVGFYVADLHTVRPSCFDIIARRDSQLLLIKILKNIDAIGQTGAHSLISLARLMRGAPLLIGSTSGGQPLEEGVLYTRYGLGILTFETLEDYLLKAIPPFLFSSPGGTFAKVNGHRLRMAREQSQTSLGAIAAMVGVSRRTIQLYEEGGGAEVDVIERLERIFEIPLAMPLNPFEESARIPRDSEIEVEGEPVEEPTPDTEKSLTSIISALGGQGWTVEVTVRSPFDAIARHHVVRQRSLVVLGVGDLSNAVRRARGLHEIARVAEGWSAFIVPERKDRDNIEGTPIIAYSELKRRRDPESLFELMEERTDG
ncbi:MAG: helix-turn-helix domain-containing protein [Candidatus Thermoplasmatota archaeon]|jgi:putative transcriptional regulator|nr:helix-turn-helix domain-containing protein [Candidatus Thermoplasmatota archaeon]